LRQLLLMAEGHGRDAWGRMSVLCALIANANRDPKKHRAYRPSDFDPYQRNDRRSRMVATKQDLNLLREALEARKGK